MAYSYTYEIDDGKNKELITVGSYAIDSTQTVDEVKTQLREQFTKVGGKEVSVRFVSKSPLFRWDGKKLLKQ